MASKDVKKEVVKDLEEMGTSAREKDGDALLDELARRYDAPREAIEKTVADWMAAEGPKPKE